jgi:hypothetical protein
MAILKNKYDLERNVDEVWYQSSNVIYSWFEEDQERNIGNLTVVFKGGKRYLYRNVSFMDYLYFKNAAFKDGSSGKAFNEYIIKKYIGEKIDDADLSSILDALNEEDPKNTTYFIHGDGEVDELIFSGMYVNTINYALEVSSETKFAVMFSNAYGMRSVKYLLDCGVDSSRITIYMKESDVSKLDGPTCECVLVKIKDERYNDDFIISEIQRRSFEDIAYISPEALAEISKVSKSAYIILKRRMM